MSSQINTLPALIAGLLKQEPDYGQDADSIDILRYLTESIGFSDTATGTLSNVPFYWGTGSPNDLIWGFSEWN